MGVSFVKVKELRADGSSEARNDNDLLNGRIMKNRTPSLQRAWKLKFCCVTTEKIPESIVAVVLPIDDTEVLTLTELLVRLLKEHLPNTEAGRQRIMLNLARPVVPPAGAIIEVLRN
eukprot:GHVN01080215.1.p1 GENE.GHVN01080215.1~~GHVN01080215.1.p1  ORF type:complete len:117 (+),score=2.01 GHVN01080215.1:70-420(+)